MSCPRLFSRWLAATILFSVAVLLSIVAGRAPKVHAARLAAPQDTTTLYAVADAFVRSWQPDTNFGSDNSIGLTYSEIDTAEEEAAIIRFDLSGLPAGAVIDSASMDLYLTSASGTSSKNILVYTVTSSWSETGVTYNNFPTIQPNFPLYATVNSTTGQYKSWLITSYAQYWQANPSQNYGVMLRRSTSETDFFDRIFESREANNHKPRLVITYHFCYPLTLSHTGSGSDPSPNPGNSTGCPAGQYVAGELITLNASPSTNWNVTAWSGTNNDASTSTTNTKTMPASASSASVTYAPISPTCYPLSLSHSGSGSDPAPNPTNSTGCSAGQYVAGELVTLTASPAAGWTVESWSGTSNNSSTSTTNSLTMPASAHGASVTYKALPPPCYTLTRAHTGTGNDPVANPPNSPGCATGKYNESQYISLEASPAGGWKVASWTGSMNDSSTQIVNSLTMPGADHTVTVNYVVVPPTCYTLSLTHSGSGGDPVPSPANSQGCPAGQYIAGAYIDLTASPNPGWEVSGWSGTSNDSSKFVPNSLTMPAANHTVSVSYESALKTITFEENIPLSSSVDSQYCNGTTKNWGVRFPSLPRISMPLTYLALGGDPIQLASPYRGLYSTLSPSTDKQIVISFTAPQHYVTVMAGLDRVYSAGVTAKLEAYSSPTPSAATLLDFDSVALGKMPVDVKQPLEVSTSSPTIRSVVIDFTSSVPVVELIDNLAFTQIGPPCANDTTAPTVQITQPDSNGKVLQTVENMLSFTAKDQETGISKVYVAFLDKNGAELTGFSACTSYMPCTAVNDKTQQGTFTTGFPTNTTKIRVTAWDYANHSGQAERTISFLLPNPNFNLWVRAVEITQGTQSWVPFQPNSRQAGSPPTYVYPATPTAVPLVAGRVTFLRIYAGLEGSGLVPLIGARARVRFNAADPNSATTWWQTATVQPTDIIDDSFDEQRSHANRSWNIMLPNNWTTINGGTGSQRTLNLEVEIEAPPGLSECTGCEDGANRLRIQNVTFTQVDPFWFRTKIYGYDWQVEGNNYPLLANQVQSNLEFIRRTYPIIESSVPVAISATGVYSDGKPEKLATSEALNKRCDDFLGFIQKQGYSDFKPTLGLISHGFPCAGLGHGNGYAFARVNSFTGAAHELGHAFDLMHAGPPPGHATECDPEMWCDKDWPWPHGTIGEWGFNTLTIEPYGPGGTELDQHDFMSYGGPNLWISPRNWIRLFNVYAHTNLNYPKATAATLVQDAAAKDYLLVRGRQLKGGWELQPVYTLPLPSGTDDLAGDGEYHIELRGTGGQVLFTRRFSLQTGHVDDFDSGAAVASLPNFSEYMPRPNGLQTIVLLHDSTTLATLAISGHAPTVTLSSPTAGGFVGVPDQPSIQWNGQDGDGDSLVYWVQYTSGGNAEWITLGLDVKGSSLPVILAGLPGGDAAKVRVLVSDGFLSSSALSPSFATANKPPSAAILAPLADSEIEEGSPLVLMGAASDIEDGQLTGDALVWSLGNQALGKGTRLDVTTLSPGSHTISLTAKDSGGQQASATVAVKVTPRVNSQPIADAGPEQWVEANSVVYLDGRNSYDADGDTLAYEWSTVGSTATGFGHLPDPTAAHAPFWASAAGDYELALTVYDGAISSSPDTVIIHVGGTPPSNLYLPAVHG